MHYTGASKQARRQEVVVKYSIEYRRYVNGAAIATLTKEIRVIQKSKMKLMDAWAIWRAERYREHYLADHPDETCTIENIYRHEEGKAPVCIYSQH